MKLPKITLTDEVKILTLTCLLLEKLGKLSESQLLEIVTVDDTITQFALNDTLTIIEKKKLAVLNSGFYEITDTGRDWLKEFQASLSIAIKQKMLREGRDVLRLDKLKKAVKWNILNEDNGWVFYACFLNEMDNSKVMEIRLHSKTRKGALEAQEKFLKDPGRVIKNMMGEFV